MSEPRKKKKELSASAAASQRLQSREDYGLVEIAEGSDAREFLLAERPRLVRATLWLSLLLLLALIGWSCVGTIDVTVSAPGVVRPRGNMVQVQSPVNGVVTELLVREGMTVNEHDVILRFDPKPLRDERALVEERINAKRSERADAEENRKRLARSFEADQQALQVEIGADEKAIGLQKADRDFKVRTAEKRLETAGKELEELEGAIKLQQAQVEKRRAQFQGGAKTKDELDNEEQALTKLELARESKKKAVEVAKIECEPNEIPVKIAEDQLEKTKSLIAKQKSAYEIKDGEAESRISQIDGEIRALQRELALIDGKLERIELRAPVGGLVTHLAVTYKGMVIPEGSTAAEISPSGRDLVLEAYVRNTDRGEIKLGRAAKIRFAAFPYQEFGALDGEVVELAPDSMKMPNDAPVGSVPDGPVYKVTVSMAKLQLENSRHEVGVVQLGMAAQADIVIKESPLIFLVLNEIKAFFDFRKQ